MVICPVCAAKTNGQGSDVCPETLRRSPGSLLFLRCLTTLFYHAELENRFDRMIIDKIYILPADWQVALNIGRDLETYRENIVILVLREQHRIGELLRQSKLRENLVCIASYEQYFANMRANDGDEKGNVIFATHDSELFEILNNPAIRDKCLVPNEGELKVVLNKDVLYNQLRNCNVPLVRGYGKVFEIEYPVVIKEKRRQDDRFWKEFNSKFVVARDFSQLENALTVYNDLHNLVFQEYIPKTPKNEFSFIGYRYLTGSVMGKVVRKTHQIKQGGVTTLAEYFTSRRIEVYSRSILEAIGYKGIFEIEFLYWEERDEYYFIDFNGRCCHWYNLLSGSGVNLPLIYVNETQKVVDEPNLFREQKFIDLHDEVMHYAVMSNTVATCFKRIFWLLRLILKESIVFSVYSGHDKRCNVFLIFRIARSVYRYYVYRVKQKVKKTIKSVL